MRRFNDNSSRVDGYKRGEKRPLEKGKTPFLKEDRRERSFRERKNPYLEEV